jgi:hypothetical protein
MQVALHDENVSPLDATLESVMPGVHQRFVAMDGTVKTLDRKIVAGFDSLISLTPMWMAWRNTSLTSRRTTESATPSLRIVSGRLQKG